MVTTILVERRGQAGYQDQGAAVKHLHEKWSQVSRRREGWRGGGYHENGYNSYKVLHRCWYIVCGRIQRQVALENEKRFVIDM